MNRTILSCIVVFTLSAVIGAMVRLIFRRHKMGWLITASAALMAAAEYGAVLGSPSPGSEAYALRTMQALCFTAGSLAAGLIGRRKKRDK